MNRTTKRSQGQTKANVPKASNLAATAPSFHNGHLPREEDVLQYRQLTAPHVDSFNYFLQVGLEKGIKDIEPIELSIVDPAKKSGVDCAPIDYQNVTTVQFWMENVKISKPSTKTPTSNKSMRLLPRECRERGLMYAGTINGTFCYNFVQRRNGVETPGRPNRIVRTFGVMPIMTMSSACHLEGMTPKQLVSVREEQTEFGGYFVVNGIERCVRLLQLPRRNHATAIQRSSYKKRGNTYTDLGVAIRCLSHCGDESSITNTLHYLTTGGCNLRFVARKQEFLVPVILLIRCLSGPNRVDTDGADVAAGGSCGMGITDEELYRRIIQDNHTNTFLVARAGLLLQDARARFGKINTPTECLQYIGARFRRVTLKAETTSDAEIGHYILRKYILIHLPHYKDKLECMLFLLRKLYSFAAGECGIDNADSLQNQEILLPGHLMSTFVKEKFAEFLERVKTGITIAMRKNFKATAAKLHEPTFWGTQVDRASQKSAGSIGKKVSYFLATGNVVSSTGLDLMQVSGFTIVAERLNFLRYCSHFRSVHRGQFFMEMKTTTVRKLLPDSWGFMCPVHTPDGGPCGLLSHLALKCKLLAFPEMMKGNTFENLDNLLISMGVSPVGAGGYEGDGRASSTHNHHPVCLDGRVIGSASVQACKNIAISLRGLKVADSPKIPPTMEVAFIPPGNPGSPYPGLFLFTGSARMVRPVIQRATGRTEYIGPLEQGFMDIACLDDDIREGVTTHQELDPTNIFSLVANMTPFSDQNQSPRNMYQCQMGKQTMGTPCHSFPYRPDNKLYRLHTPQAAISQTFVHGQYKMDEYPNGTNAVVGFDMEDAMILNKSAYERGFAHASVYKTVLVNLAEEAKMAGVQSTSGDNRIQFGNGERRDGQRTYSNLEPDGFPKIGDRIVYGDAICSTLDTLTKASRGTKHKERELAYVQNVRLLGSESGSVTESKAKITLRFPRNPTIGDKFASRHGQKGVLSILWPNEDMPFSESGISPDIIINPHAFPSRMTIGMLVESMAGKSGALHGHFQDATPFSFHESGDKVSLDYFGEELQAAGYNYYGSEALHSGTSGCVMQADLYIGIVYYQRLRHMVSDKYQVRATGTVNPLTRQPIKGRKKGGGIRLGEMERDSLLSHGAAFLLQDRLLNCSDRHVAYVCSRCGDMLMPSTQRSIIQTTGQSAADAVSKPKLRLYCRSPGCLKASENGDGNDECVEPIVLPYVYRYLVNELAAMNVKMKMEIR